MSDRRAVLVTGARKGIGRAVAEHCVKQGYAVVGCGRKPADWEAGGFTYLQADVTDESDVKRIMKELVSNHGGVYGVINNAANARMNHMLLTPADSLDKMLATNVRGTFLVSRESAKLMRKAGVGRIINVSSVAVPMRLEGQAAYVASKAAVERLSQVMASELADFGITVNVVGATPIDTDMIRGVPKEKIERLVQSLAVKRLGTIADVTNVIDFFLQDASDAITGQVIYLGGVPNG